MRTNPITPTIDLHEDGVRHGFLRLPHSRDDSAWGAVMIPFAVVKNGEGPTALLTGGNHGDEYEGPVALFDLANTLKQDDIQGRVIIVPAMNYPAFRARSRISPLDGGNLNRSFPGRPDGSVTEIIADFFSRTLLPEAEYVLDFHSGGKSLDFLPFAACHDLSDKQQEARCRAAMDAFHAPYSVKMIEMDPGGLYDTAAESQGKVFVTTELGGGGTTTPRTLRIARRGVRNFLIHAGILTGEIETRVTPPVALEMPDDRAYIHARHTGLAEHCISLGDEVKEGDVVLRIHIIERTAVPSIEYRAEMDGLLICRHVPGMVQIGDCLAVIGHRVD